VIMIRDEDPGRPIACRSPVRAKASCSILYKRAMPQMTKPRGGSMAYRSSCWHGSLAHVCIANIASCGIELLPDMRAAAFGQMAFSIRGVSETDPAAIGRVVGGPKCHSSYEEPLRH
jgi:hypothetical protein